MKKRGIVLLLAITVTAGAIGGCGKTGQENQSTGLQMENEEEVSGDTDAAGMQNQTAEQADGSAPDEQISQGAEKESGDDEIFFPTYTGPFSAKEAAVNEDIGVTPCVAPYTIEADLSNVDNLWQFYLGDEQKEMIAQNGFVVCGDAGREFFEIYEINRYVPVASFVTVDSLMHTYHLYFEHLLKKVEKQYLR